RSTCCSPRDRYWIRRQPGTLRLSFRHYRESLPRRSHIPERPVGRAGAMPGATFRTAGRRGRAMITIELFGVPRLRAGTGSVRLDAASLALALSGLGRLCPALDGSVIAGGAVHPAYRVCLNGEQFVSDPATPLADGDVLLLMAADVGG